MTDRDVASAYFRAYLSQAPLAASLWRSNEALAMHRVQLNKFLKQAFTA